MGVCLAISRFPEAAGSRPSFVHRTVAVAGIALVVLLAFGIVLAYRFIAAERARDLAAWQSRLGLIADGRALAVSDWLARQFAEIGGLAENASVQLYMTELAAEGGD